MHLSVPVVLSEHLQVDWDPWLVTERSSAMKRRKQGRHVDIHEEFTVFVCAGSVVLLSANR